MNKIQFRIKRQYNFASFQETRKCSFNYDLLARLVCFHFRINLFVKQSVNSSWLPIKKFTVLMNVPEEEKFDSVVIMRTYKIPLTRLFLERVRF